MSWFGIKSRPLLRSQQISIEERLQRIRDLDLSYVRERAARLHGWGSAQADRAEQLYREFLMMFIHHPDERFGPVGDTHQERKDMDDFWHQHIVFTHEYDRDTRHVIGKFLHHSPDQEIGPAEKSEREQRTQQTYEQDRGRGSFNPLAAGAAGFAMGHMMNMPSPAEADRRRQESSADGGTGAYADSGTGFTGPSKGDGAESGQGHGDGSHGDSHDGGAGADSSGTGGDGGGGGCGGGGCGGGGCSGGM